MSSASKFYLLLSSEQTYLELYETENPPIYNDFLHLSQIIKNIPNARFKVFENIDKAKKYGKYFKKLNDKNAYEYLSDDVFKSQSFEEKPLPYKAPKSLDIIKFRNLLTNPDDLFSFLKTNPRLLISHGDTPVILQEGARYNALHFCARKCTEESAKVCAIILQFLSDDQYYRLLYPDDTKESVNHRKLFLTDLYLNMPDKLLFETPLHMASKFGNVSVIEILISHPFIDKTCLNKDGLRSDEIICNRYNTGSDKDIVAAKIKELLQDQYYIPIIRNETDSHLFKTNFNQSSSSTLNDNLSPRLGKPFKSNPTLKFLTNITTNFPFGEGGDGFMENKFSVEVGEIFNIAEHPFKHLGYSKYLPTHEHSLAVATTTFNRKATTTTYEDRIDALAGPFDRLKATQFYEYFNKLRKKWFVESNSGTTNVSTSFRPTKTSFLSFPFDQEFSASLIPNASHDDDENKITHSTKSFHNSRFSINSFLTSKIHQDILDIPFSMDIILKDHDKGLETLGRHLAKSMNVPWYEKWTFLDSIPYTTEQSTRKSEDNSKGDYMSTFNNSSSSYVHANFVTLLPDVLQLEDITSPKGLAKFDSYLKDRQRQHQENSSFFVPNGLTFLIESNCTANCITRSFIDHDDLSSPHLNSSDQFFSYRNKFTQTENDNDFERDCGLSKLLNIADEAEDVEPESTDIKENEIETSLDDLCSGLQLLNLGNEKQNNVSLPPPPFKVSHSRHKETQTSNDSYNLSIFPLKRRFSKLLKQQSTDATARDHSKVNKDIKKISDEKCEVKNLSNGNSGLASTFFPPLISSNKDSKNSKEGSPSKMVKLNPPKLQIYQSSLPDKFNQNESNSILPSFGNTPAPRSSMFSRALKFVSLISSPVPSKQPPCCSNNNQSSREKSPDISSGDESEFFTPPQTPVKNKSSYSSNQFSLHLPLPLGNLNIGTPKKSGGINEFLASTPFSKSGINSKLPGFTVVPPVYIKEGSTKPTKIDLDVFKCINHSTFNRHRQMFDSVERNLEKYPHVLAWYNSMNTMISHENSLSLVFPRDTH